MRGSYLRREGLHLEEDVAYEVAVLLPFRECAPGSFDYEVLLGLVPDSMGPGSQMFKYFGGRKDLSDQTALDTAVRRLTQEAGELISDRAVTDIRMRAQKAGAIWIRQGRVVVYPVNLGDLAIPNLRQVRDLPGTIPSVRQSGPRRGCETVGASWVTLSSVLIPASQPQSRWDPTMAALREDAAFQHWTRSPLTATDKGFGDLVGEPMKERPSPTSRTGAAEGASPPVAITGANVRVTGLPPEFTDEDLGKLCSVFGTLKRFTVWLEPGTQICKGYGFVEFETEEGAEQAMQKLNGNTLGSAKEPVQVTRNYPRGHALRPQGGKKGKGKGKGKGYKGFQPS